MTRQEIFDAVIDHLSAQNRPAREPAGLRWHKLRLQHGNAVYTSPSGHFIDAANYSPAMEDKPVTDVIDEFPAAVPAWFRDEAEFLQELDETHDSLPGNVETPWGPEERQEVCRKLWSVGDAWELDTGIVFDRFHFRDPVQGKTLGERIATEFSQ